MPKKRRFKFRGNDRALMMLQKDVRRRWKQYGENRPYNLKIKNTKCAKCKNRATEWDHIIPVGTRFYKADDFPAYWKKMFEGQTQPLCRDCNRKKGAKNE